MSEARSITPVSDPNCPDHDAPQRPLMPLVMTCAMMSLALLIGIVIWQQRSQLATLRRIAREIQPGENIREVDIRLGKSKFGYSYPAGPGLPDVFGAMYGGAMNDYRENLEHLFRQAFGGFPSWYRTQHEISWPVVVQYDDTNKRVTAVFVDGVKITSAVLD